MRITQTKFWLTVAVLAAASWFLADGAISEETWKQVMQWLAAAYVGGNVAATFAHKKGE